MNLLKIHHIAIIVSDYKVAKDFYVNKLGFSVIRENYRPERKDWKLDLRVNEHTELEIFAEENPPKRVLRTIIFRSPMDKTPETMAAIIPKRYAGIRDTSMPALNASTSSRSVAPSTAGMLIRSENFTA